MSVGGWLSFVGKVLSVIWALKSLVFYHTLKYEDWIQDLRDSPLGLNNATLEGFGEMIKPYGAEKADAMKMHTVVGLLIMIALVMQLSKPLRDRAKGLHRWTGRILILGSLVATPGFATLTANMGSVNVKYAHSIALFMIPFYGIKGWLEIRSGDVASHKSSMIMFSAAFFYFPLQRLVMAFFNPIHHAANPLSKYTPLGPWQDWKDGDFSIFFDSAIFLASVLTWSGAVYKAYGAPAKVPPKAKTN